MTRSKLGMLLILMVMPSGSSAGAWAPSLPTPLPDVSRLTSNLCTECRNIWLDSTSQRDGNVRATGNLAGCFQLMNESCYDCIRGRTTGSNFDSRTAGPFGAAAACTHASWYSTPQPISGQFSFCSGHAAGSADAMSMTAWIRLM